MEAGVQGVLAVVAHDPDAVLGDLDRAEGVLAGDGAGVEVRGLVQGDAVEDDLAALLAGDGVAADRDDPLDEVLLLGGRHEADEAEELLDDIGRGRGLALEPAARVVEDDDFAALGLGAEPGGQFVDEDPVALLEGVHHRFRGDRERLHQEGLDQQGEYERDADEEGQFLPEGTLLLGGPAGAARRFVVAVTVARRTTAGRVRLLVTRHVVTRRVIAEGPAGPLVGLIVSGSCADGQIPHIHSSVRANACPGTGTGPPLP